VNLVSSGLAGIQAAARDEILARHRYEETQEIDQLPPANTDLTRDVHDLTQKVRQLTQQLCTG
jgi:hypothetical protein